MALPGIGRTTAGSILSSALNAPLLPWMETSNGAGAPRPSVRQLATMPCSGSGARPCSIRCGHGHQPGLDGFVAIALPASRIATAAWQPHCAAYAAGDPCRWPVTDAPKPLPFQVIGVVLSGGGGVDRPALEEGLLVMWEFLGGKQEPGETIETCIARELKEELGIAATVGAELITVDHAYSHKKLRFVHLCDWLSEPQPLPVSRCVGCSRMTLALRLSGR